ncbi:MAG TPA: hypothetical protein VKT82_00400 [Ktedonobacterales bacterium]|nr:hypothetical protein [Ktedonobacterales bacterium]
MATEESAPTSTDGETPATSEGSETAESGEIIVPTADTLPASEADAPKETAVPSESTAETPESQPSDDIAVLVPNQPTGQSTTGDALPAPSARYKALPRSRIIKIALIAAAVLLVLGATGAGILYALTRPQPVISVTSDYHVGSVPAGSTSTILHIEGSQFSSYSAIIFLLDGRPAPDSLVYPSDQNGNIEADLVITARWTPGAHHLTARDASGATTHASSTIMIVQQGQANTPGPNGAPADDTPRFTLWMTGGGSQFVVAFASNTGGAPGTLTVQGQPDPAGGSVCNLTTDTGKPTTITYPTPSNLGIDTGSGGIIFVGPINSLQKVTTAYTCSGTYQSGKISYTETNTIDTVVFSDGLTCKLAAPRVTYQMQGAFTSATSASGTYSVPASELKCSDGSIEKTSASTGIWTALMTM